MQYYLANVTSFSLDVLKIAFPFIYSPVHDAFEDSSRLQALDEIVHRDFKLDDTTNNTTPTYYSCPVPAEPKRKIGKISFKCIYRKYL